MFRVEIHQTILDIFELFYRLGYWNPQETETVRQRLLKWFHFLYFSIFPILSLAGASVSDDTDDKVFPIQVALMCIVCAVKLFYIFWGKGETLRLLNEICVYCVDDRDAFIALNSKCNILMKISKALLSAAIVIVTITLLVAPFVGAERRLFFKFWFPLDWRSDEYTFWMAFFYVSTEIVIAATALPFSGIMWYIMAQCGWRYEILGRQFKKMGEIDEIDEQGDKPRISEAEKDSLYCRDLVCAIKQHNHLRELTDQLNSFLAHVFVFQLITGAFCICASIYCIIFVGGDSYLDLICYILGLVINFFEILMIMYFGNEIKLEGEKLSYRLYESNWVDRSLSIKRDILIFGEFLRQPQELMVLKIYPLTLETFTRILNSAYSMFNVLKNFK